MDASYLFYALGAVGNLSSLSLLIIGFSTEMANGFAVIIAQNYGADNHSVLRKSIALSVKLSNLTAARIMKCTRCQALEEFYTVERNRKSRRPADGRGWKWQHHMEDILP